VEKSFKNYKGKERLFVEKMREDTNLPLFVDRHTVFQNVKYDEDAHRAFARGYVTNQALETYEKERISNVKKEVLEYHYEDMMKELDALDEAS